MGVGSGILDGRRAHLSTATRCPEQCMPDLKHPDELLGALARVVQVLRPRVENTIDRVGAYEGLPLSALFPAPDRVPTVTRSTRWRIGGVASEDLSFASLHEPIEPAFRRYYHARRRRIHTVYARRIRRASGLERPRLLYIAAGDARRGARAARDDGR